MMIWRNLTVIPRILSLERERSYLVYVARVNPFSISETFSFSAAGKIIASAQRGINIDIHANRFPYERAPGARSRL